MKRIFLNIFVAVMALGLVSCNNEVVIQDDTTKIEAFENLFSEIEVLNSSFQFDDHCYELRWWRPNWRNVAHADVVGAAAGFYGAGPLGALGLGTIFSVVALLLDPVFNNSIDLNDWQDGVPMHILGNDEIGALHNKFIREILLENPKMLQGNVSTDEVISLVNAKLNEHNFASSETELRRMMDSDALTVIDKIVRSDNLVYTMGELVRFYPGLKKEFQVIASVAAGVERIRTEETMVEYTLEVLNVVNASNIPTASREIINASLVVYANSFALWGD